MSAVPIALPTVSSGGRRIARIGKANPPIAEPTLITQGAPS